MVYYFGVIILANCPLPVNCFKATSLVRSLVVLPDAVNRQLPSVPGAWDVPAGSTTRDAEGFPFRTTTQLGKLDDLADVVAVVGDLAVDGVEHGEGHAPDGDRLEEVVGLKRAEGVERAGPTLLPECEGLGVGVGARLELPIAVAPGLVAVAREEVGPSAQHVAVDVLHGHGDAVGLWVRGIGHVGVAELDQRAVAQFLEVFKALHGGVEEFVRKVCHGALPSCPGCRCGPAVVLPPGAS